MAVKTADISHQTSNLTDLQDYFNQANNRPHTRDIPRLSENLLKRARNGISHSQDNNDLLEFIGDRAVNLASALLIENVKLSKAHHTVRFECLSFPYGVEINQSLDGAIGGSPGRL